MARRIILMAVLAPIAALAGCMSGPNYAPPPSPPALQSHGFLRGGADASAEPPLARWWEGLGDPQLSGLIARGLADAPTLVAAEARLRQARAGNAGDRAGLLPTLGPSALYAKAHLPGEALGGSSGDIDLFNVGFDAQWELDLWGGKRRTVEASKAEAGAAAARLADAQVSLSAEIARRYIDLRARQSGLVLLAQREDLDHQLLILARERFAGGTAAHQSVEAAEAQWEGTQADQAQARAEVTALRDGLAVLVGAVPGALDDLPSGAIPLPPAQLVVGDPAGMLGRRPDIRVAERKFAAAHARIGVEVAQRYPQVSLMGILGVGGSSASDLFDSAQISTIALPRLTWNFIDFGRTAAAVRGARAGSDAALADYHAAVLSALQDAESALGRYGAARIAAGDAMAQASHARAIAALQTMRAHAGTLAAADAIAADRQALDALQAEEQARAAMTQAYVAVAKSLGLGWNAPPAHVLNRQ